MSDWTTPDDIRLQLRRYWNTGRLLSAELLEEPMYPLVLSLKKPGTSDLTERFDDVRAWIRQLETGSYQIEWTIRNHRQLGRNRLPLRVVIPCASDAWKLIGKQEEAETFLQLALNTLAFFPTLKAWLIRNPFRVLDHANHWSKIIDVLAWLVANRASKLYIRQIEIPGVDTKFIGEHARMLAALMDEIDGSPSNLSFEERFGFLSRPLLVRFRLLDPAIRIAGLSDLTIPHTDFARLSPAVHTVFITENELNGLTFPDRNASLVIFKLGFALDRLREAKWLQEKKLYYWGDIDTHGFVMLSRARSIFPGIQSFLMDRETLFAHPASWVEEAVPSQEVLGNLTEAEQSLYCDLQRNEFGQRVRLEQERISFSLFRDVLRNL